MANANFETEKAEEVKDEKKPIQEEKPKQIEQQDDESGPRPILPYSSMFIFEPKIGTFEFKCFILTKKRDIY